MKAPQTKRTHTLKTETKLMATENPLGPLGLTAREREVLALIAQGKTNYEIGVILSACTGTICKHVEHILCKLNVKNRTAAAAIALAAVAKATFERSGAMMYRCLLMCVFVSSIVQAIGAR
jgi:DNA-binding NarL/FixJ family response regulator